MGGAEQRRAASLARAVEDICWGGVDCGGAGKTGSGDAAGDGYMREGCEGAVRYCPEEEALVTQLRKMIRATSDSNFVTVHMWRRGQFSRHMCYCIIQNTAAAMLSEFYIRIISLVCTIQWLVLL